LAHNPILYHFRLQVLLLFVQVVVQVFVVQVLKEEAFGVVVLGLVVVIGVVV
jgi:hypothetical protein